MNINHVHDQRRTKVLSTRKGEHKIVADNNHSKKRDESVLFYGRVEAMIWLITGFGLGLAVSVPPGANTMLCLTRARSGGWRYGMPTAFSAATADSIYALLAGLGVLTAALVGIATELHIATVFFLLFCAYLLYPKNTVVSTRSASLVASMNPPAALLWFALAGSLNHHPPSALTMVFFVVGAAAATLTWFTLVAVASHRLAHILSDQVVRSATFVVCAVLVGLALRQALVFF